MQEAVSFLNSRTLEFHVAFAIVEAPAIANTVLPYLMRLRGYPFCVRECLPCHQHSAQLGIQITLSVSP